MGADSARGRCAGGCGSSEPAAVWPLPEPVALQVVQRAVSGADLRNVPLDRLLALSQESHGLRPLYRTGSDRRGGCPGLGCDADVRGYTQMTEGLSAGQVPEAMNRFYEASSRALSAAEALLGQIEGDLVMGVFVPGLAGRHFRRKAVEGASRLLRMV